MNGGNAEAAAPTAAPQKPASQAQNSANPASVQLPKPQPNAAEIRRTFQLFFTLAAVIEIRAIHKKGRKRIDAGYFDIEHIEDAITAAVKANRGGANVYITLNPVKELLHGRYHNRIQEWADSTATDADIISRVLLLVDGDPVRPKDTAATDAQLALSKETARQVRDYLREQGWPDPIIALSGNGYHLLYRIDLPNDDASTELVKGVLNALAARFNTDEVKLDCSVFNAARITKLYGTVSTKGDHTPTQPQRLSRIGSIPGELWPVTTEQLQALAPAGLVAQQATAPRSTGDKFDVAGWLDKNGLEYTKDRHGNRDRYKLKVCPFNENHVNGEAAVLQDDDGKLGFKCMHEGCKDNHWKDLRELFDGPREARASLDLSQILAGFDSTDAPAPSDDEVIAKLAALPLIEYDRLRTDAAKKLNIRTATLDKQVAAKRPDTTTAEQTDSFFPDVEPCDEPVDGADLLFAVYELTRRFVVCNRETAVAATLWVVMTWFIDVLDVAPKALIKSPEMRCGKTTFLAVMKRLGRRSLAVSNITSQALYRTITAWRPSLFIDEYDSFLEVNEELRGILNSGHTRDSAFVIRLVGDDMTPTLFDTFAPIALAGIGNPPPTILDRSIPLELRRKTPGEHVERLRYADPELFSRLVSQIARFAEDNLDAVRCARPEIPGQLNDRQQDCWSSLLAIADVAGGDWPKMARDAAKKISGSGDEPTIGCELLADIREIFTSKGIDRIDTTALIFELCMDDERPWATYNRGAQIRPRQIAAKLKGYGILSKTIRFGSLPSDTRKGYEVKQFSDAFIRYLDTPPVSVTTSQPSIHAGSSDFASVTSSVTDDVYPSHVTKIDGGEVVTCDVCEDVVTDAVTDKETSQRSKHAGCDVVTDKTPPSGDNTITDLLG